MDRLRSLQLFRHVATLGSFSAASRECGVPQPSISRAIAELEADLGVRLLNRTTRRVGLTAQGRRYLERVDDALRCLSEAESVVRTGFAEIEGDVRVSLPGVIGRRLVAPRLTRALLDHPSLRVELAFSDGLGDLTDRAFDFAIRVSGAIPEAFVALPIVESRQCVVASPTYLAGRTLPASMSKLDGHHGVFRDARTASLFESAGLTTRFIADDLELAWRATRDGLGISVVPFWLVREDLVAERLVELFPGAPKPAGRITAVHLRTHELGPAARFVLDVVSQHIRDAVMPLPII
ncbi:MAG: LysR family transcriptional regulator [Myxococcales bacterium]|nr:LysR family transcriptional regulator [Myxococcales bacterium]